MNGLPPAYPHQQKEVDTYGCQPRRALFWSPRTGKTRAAIESMIKAGKTSAVVVTPLSTCPQWADLLEVYGFTVLRGYSMPRPALLKALRTAAPKTIVVASWRRIGSQTPDERKQKRKSAVLNALLSFNAQAVILDESHNMASASATQAKAARQLAWNASWVRLLTGTPAPNHYGSLWGQLVALDREQFCSSFEKFACRYLIRDTMFRNRVLGHLSTVESHLQPLMIPFVSFVRRADVFGPDKFIETVRAIEMPGAAKTLYKKLASKWLIDDPALALNVDATQVLKRLIRLQQVAAGYVPADDGVIHALHEAKLDAVEEDLEQIVNSNEKAVVFHRFRWEGAQLLARARKLGVPVYEISGDTPVVERATCIAAMESPGAKIAIVQTRSGGVGISFAEVPYQLVISQSFSFTDEEQAHDRTYKPKIARFVTYYRMAETVDFFIADVLETKTNIHTAVANADHAAMAFGRIPKRRLQKAS